MLDTALAIATASPYGRVTPSFLACLDELPSTTPLPTLRVRMANERALGLSFMYAAQTWRQMVVCYGEDEARSLDLRSRDLQAPPVRGLGDGQDAVLSRGRPGERRAHRHRSGG